MTNQAVVNALFDVDFIDVQIIELYSYRLYDEQAEEQLQSLSVAIVNQALAKLTLPAD